MKRPVSWLERDDESALGVKRQWQARALRRAEMYGSSVDAQFVELVAYCRRTVSRGFEPTHDVNDLREIAFPFADPSSEIVAAALVASLTIDPPRT
jgi:hypothetical protein